MTADAAVLEKTDTEDTLKNPEASENTTGKSTLEGAVHDELEALALKYLQNAQKSKMPPESSAPGGAPKKSGADTSTEPQSQATGGGTTASQRTSIRKYIALAAAVGILAAWFLARVFPNYLLYETPAIKTDAVVLFLGPGEKARRKQVDKLVAGELARFVIVPWTGKIIESGAPDKPIETEEASEISGDIKADVLRFYVERTHIEMLQARALMDHIGVTSANFVSSPYHMRRIKIMAAQVFDADRYTIAFVPTGYEPRHVPWFLAGQDVKWVFSEWGKIIWFLLYSPFVG